MFAQLLYLCPGCGGGGCGGGGADVSSENPESFLKEDESTMRKEFDVKMMLIVAVSMPNDVSGATH